MERKVIVIAGPTCSGKTYLGIRLAEELNTEIISADSRQVYKMLDIGTAKPSQEELSRVKHHFINELEPEEVYNASRFENEALSVIDSLHRKNKIPVVVGGSGLYIKALTDGIIDEIDVDDEYRNELLLLRKEKGNEYLYDLLKDKDPIAASSMLPSNWKRVMRALEVYHLSGKSIKEFHKEQKRDSNLQFFRYALLWDREKLYKNIETRVDQMIRQGLVNEVKNLLDAGYSKNLNSLNTVGYKEIISYLENEISLERAVELIKRNTRRFAKRQMTWFKKDNMIQWINVDGKRDLDDSVSRILSQTGQV